MDKSKSEQLSHAENSLQLNIPEQDDEAFDHAVAERLTYRRCEADPDTDLYLMLTDIDLGRIWISTCVLCWLCKPLSV